MEYYKPKIISEDPVKIHNSGYSGELPKNTKDGFINTDIEKDIVIQRISKDLYASPSSGIRELYANEARACRNTDPRENPWIRLTINQDNRGIILEGINSSGMSWDVFRNVYCVLGRSTNFDGKESGQFGFGRAAYTCISDIMILETHCRETGEKYAVMGKSGIGFQTGLPEPNMGNFGTRVSMTARDDVSIESIKDMVRKCSVLSGVTTEIVTVMGNDLHTEYVHPATLGDCIKSTYNEDMPILHKKYYHEISHEDVDIVFAVTGVGMRHGRGVKSAGYLCGVPIEFKYYGRYKGLFSHIAVNIKDERKYRPTPDRERLAEETTNSVIELIDKQVTEYIKSHTAEMDELDYLEYLDSKYAKLGDSVRCCGFEEFGESGTEKYHETLHYGIVTRKNTEKRLGDLVTGSDLLVTERFNANIMDVMEEHFPKMVVVRPRHADRFETLVNLGVGTLRDFMAKNKLKPRKKDRNNGIVRVYSQSIYRQKNHRERMRDTCDFDGMFSVSLKEFSQLEEYGKKFREYTARRGWDKLMPYYYVKSNSLPDNAGRPFGELYNIVGNHIFDTNNGIMTARQIFDSELKIKMDPLGFGKYVKNDVLLVNIDPEKKCEFWTLVFLSCFDGVELGYVQNNDLKKKHSGNIELVFGESQWLTDKKMEFLNDVSEFKTPEAAKYYIEHERKRHREWNRQTVAEKLLELEKVMLQRHEKCQ